MELDRITVTVRPRSPWEAIDLGFAMARAWYLPLWLLWLTLALPLYLLATLLFGELSAWAILIVWWCKPAYEPLLLYWLSRALFADRIAIRSALRQAFSVIRPQLVANLTWRRLNPNRSFNMPVTVLEKLGGRARKKRIAVLGRGQQASTWLTIIGLMFEFILQVSFIFLIILMLPDELRWLELDSFLFDPGRLEQGLQHLGDLLAMSLIAPFYVAAGFSLYLSRRTDLEAWDIEIAFRRLAGHQTGGRRVRRAGLPGRAALLLCATLLSGGYATELPATTNMDPAEAKTVIDQVLADEAFGERRSVTYWRYIGANEEVADDPDALPGFMKWILEVLEGFTRGFAAFGKALLLIVAGVLLAWLLYKAWASRDYRAVRQPAAGSRGVPASLFGLPLERHTLPADIPGACRGLLRKGDARAALSLLYRGVLVALLEQGSLEIPESATEGECVERVLALCPTEQGAYFARLTDVWIGAAYGHRAVDEQRMLGLCAEWQRLFGGVVEHAE